MSAASEALPQMQHLVKTVAFLCERGVFGYAELDTDYRALWRYGELASWIPIGVNICRHTDLFFGLEKELLDLQDEDGACMTLPRIGLPCSGHESSKISVEAFWDEQASVYHVVIHRLIAESEVELELLKQIRARRLAEENFQATGEKLARKQMLLDIIMEHLPVAAAVFDDRRRYLFASQRWAQHFRIDCEPLIGQDVVNAGPAFPAVERQQLEASFGGLPVAQANDTQKSRLEDTRGYRWTHKRWLYTEESQGGVLTTVEDITDLFAENQRLQLLNERLHSANQQLARFASIIAHDLRAPLRSLLAALNAPHAAAEGGDGSAALVNRVERMNAILDGMDDYLKALCFEPVLRAVSIKRLVEEIVASLPNGTAFVVEPRLKQNEIHVNPGMLDLVLRNLLDNAVKHHHGPSGKLVVSLDEDEAAWLIGVEDDGPGMSPEQRAAFLDVRTEDRGWEKAMGGGLGLRIVKRAIEGVGGTVHICSGAFDRRGTRVVIRWPKDLTTTG